MEWPLRQLSALTLFCFSLACFAGDQDSPTTNVWKIVNLPSRPVNITAEGTTIWVCGVDETIASSKDGGATWQTTHQSPDGEVVFVIAFVNDRVGHAAGTGGLLLSTDDGGQTWKRHIAPGAVRAFSFANATDGIAVISDGSSHRRPASFDQVAPMDGVVKITHDGGDHWDDIVAVNSEELRPFVQTLAVAAIDNLHFLMLRRQPEVQDVFIFTKDGGKSWKLGRPRNDATNRELPDMVFVHASEYWALGYELVHREKGGGYGVPLVLHSKDGEAWTHGAAGPKEFTSCSSRGCYLWDGAVEVLYGEKEQFWSLPQDGSLGKRWAIAENNGCTISGNLKCGRATITEKPLDQPEGRGVVISSSSDDQTVAEGCVECHFEAVAPEHSGPPSVQRIQASIKIRRNGTVASVSAVYLPSQRMSDEISSQLSKWLFEPTHKGANTVEATKDVSLVLMCAGFPDRPETNRCILHSASEFSGMR